jgi:predicted acyl esterase
VCEDYSAIQCPVYAVGGWADGYTNSVVRLLANLQGPRKGLIGPWAHVYPHEGVPGPAIGFLQEALRWWDHWLKEIDTGIMAEPMLRAWLEDSAEPTSRTGRWVVEDAWPPKRSAPACWFLQDDGGLRRAPSRGAEDRVRKHCSPLTTGSAAGGWCGFGHEGDQPTDQRVDDTRSLCYDSEPLAQACEFLGSPVLRLRLQVDQPLGFLAVRLNDVGSDGTSSRITYGLLNLTHRDGHEHPQPAPVDQPFEVEVQLNDAGHVLAAGHRLRLAISTSYWPLAWPSPRPVTVQVFGAGSALWLPVRTAHRADHEVAPFAVPETAAPARMVDLHPGGVERRIEHDAQTGVLVHTVRHDLNRFGDPALTRIEPIDLEFGHAMTERYVLSEPDPLSARAEIEHEAVLRRAAWSARVVTTQRLWADAESFFL